MKKPFKKATLRLIVFTSCVLAVLVLFGLDQGFNNGIFLVPTFFTIGTAIIAWVDYDTAHRSVTNFVLDLWKNPKGADETAYELKKYSGDKDAQDLIVFHVIERGKRDILFARCFITRARELGFHNYAQRVIQKVRPYAIRNVEEELKRLYPSTGYSKKELLHFFQTNLLSNLVVLGNNIEEKDVAEAYDEVKAKFCYFFERGSKEFLDQFFQELQTTKIIAFRGEEKEKELLQEIIRKIVKLLTLNNKMGVT